jgi:hypothetical protein
LKKIYYYHTQYISTNTTCPLDFINGNFCINNTIQSNYVSDIDAFRENLDSEVNAFQSIYNFGTLNSI